MELGHISYHELRIKTIIAHCQSHLLLHTVNQTNIIPKMRNNNCNRLNHKHKHAVSITTIIKEYEGDVITTNPILKCHTLLITKILTNY
jgi:hypothetical protein